MRRRTTGVAAVATFLLLAWVPVASAAQHLISVREVYPGSVAEAGRRVRRAAALRRRPAVRRRSRGAGLRPDRLGDRHLQLHRRRRQRAEPAIDPDRDGRRADAVRGQRQPDRGGAGDEPGRRSRLLGQLRLRLLGLLQRHPCPLPPAPQRARFPTAPRWSVRSRERDLRRRSMAPTTATPAPPTSPLAARPRHATTPPLPARSPATAPAAARTPSRRRRRSAAGPRTAPATARRPFVSAPTSRVRGSSASSTVGRFAPAARRSRPSASRSDLTQ